MRQWRHSVSPSVFWVFASRTWGQAAVTAEPRVTISAAHFACRSPRPDLPAGSPAREGGGQGQRGRRQAEPRAVSSGRKEGLLSPWQSSPLSPAAAGDNDLGPLLPGCGFLPAPLTAGWRGRVAVPVAGSGSVLVGTLTCMRYSSTHPAATVSHLPAHASALAAALPLPQQPPCKPRE